MYTGTILSYVAVKSEGDTLSGCDETRDHAGELIEE